MLVRSDLFLTSLLSEVLKQRLAGKVRVGVGVLFAKNNLTYCYYSTIVEIVSPKCKIFL